MTIVGSLERMRSYTQIRLPFQIITDLSTKVSKHVIHITILITLNKKNMIVIQNLKMHRGSKIKNVFKYFDVNLDMGIVEKV